MAFAILIGIVVALLTMLGVTTIGSFGGTSETLTDTTLAGNTSITGNCTITDAMNVSVGTSTGTSFGTATTQKMSFWGVTPVVQPPNTTDLYNTLVNTGLMASGGTPPFSPPGNVAMADGKNVSIGTSTGTQIGTASNQKIGFYGLTAIVQPAGNGTQATAAAGATTTIFANTTLTGGSGSTAYTVGDVVKCLKQLGLIQT